MLSLNESIGGPGEATEAVFPHEEREMLSARISRKQ